MKKSVFLMVVCWLCYLTTTSQNILQVVDENDQSLIGATIELGTYIFVTDIDGQAKFEVPPGTYSSRISFVGYEPHIDSLEIPFSQLKIISLSPSILQMEDLVVTQDRILEQLESTTSGFQSISMKDVESLPFLLGEKDPIKIIQLQAGVISGADGNNGYYVRGGGVDQNMIRLDNIELYNANHLFGFFSMFPGEAIERIDFYKSGLPAQHGRRLSSTMEVTSRNPDLFKPSGSVSLGVLSISALGETPLVKGKTGLMMNVRRSYLDLITQNLLPRSSELRNRTNYQLFDGLIKLTHRFNSRNALSFTGFTGSDNYLYRGSQAISNQIFWSTTNLGVTLKHLGKRNTDSEYFLTFGNYDQRFAADISAYRLRLSSSIRDASAGAKYYFSPTSNMLLLYGGETVLRGIRPNNVTLGVGGSEEFTVNATQEIRSLESALFGDLDFSITQDLQAGIGLRLSHYAMLGPYTSYISDPSTFTISDTVNYNAWSSIAEYLNLEPRLRLNYKWTESLSLKFSYDRNSQYIHLSPVSSVSLPSDIWVPSSGVVRPQLSDQLAINGVKAIDRNSVVSVSAYYKLLYNQMEYRNGAIIGYASGNNFDDAFIFGTGKSRGLEFSYQKLQGRLQGQLSYTLSKTMKVLPEANFGQPFPAKYDRPHDLNLTAQYFLQKWTFSCLFKYATGGTLTLPIAKYVVGGNVVSEYLERNAVRLPDYHRMDISATYYPQEDRKTSWNFSVYNLYNRDNPYYVFFDVEGNLNEYRLDVDLEQVSLFPILPSVTYRRQF